MTTKVPPRQLNSETATAGQVLTADGSGGSAFTHASLGTGQTWQAVTRTAGTTYTNSTGKPIMLKILITTSTNYVLGSTTVSINSGSAITVAGCGGATVGQTIACGEIIIPNGSSYVFTDSNLASRTTWELS